MMLDADVPAASPTSVDRVLKGAGLIGAATWCRHAKAPASCSPCCRTSIGIQTFRMSTSAASSTFCVRCLMDAAALASIGSYGSG